MPTARHPNVLESHMKFICNYLIYSRSGEFASESQGIPVETVSMIGSIAAMHNVNNFSSLEQVDKINFKKDCKDMETTKCWIGWPAMYCDKAKKSHSLQRILCKVKQPSWVLKCRVAQNGTVTVPTFDTS